MKTADVQVVPDGKNSVIVYGGDFDHCLDTLDREGYRVVSFAESLALKIKEDIPQDTLEAEPSSKVHLYNLLPQGEWGAKFYEGCESAEQLLGEGALPGKVSDRTWKHVGHFTLEAVLYNAGKYPILLPHSPILKNPIRAVKLAEEGLEYTLTPAQVKRLKREGLSLGVCGAHISLSDLPKYPQIARLFQAQLFNGSAGMDLVPFLLRTGFHSIGFGYSLDSTREGLLDHIDEKRPYVRQAYISWEYMCKTNDGEKWIELNGVRPGYRPVDPNFFEISIHPIRFRGLKREIMTKEVVTI